MTSIKSVVSITSHQISSVQPTEAFLEVPYERLVRCTLFGNAFELLLELGVLLARMLQLEAQAAVIQREIVEGGLQLVEQAINH